VVRLHCPPGREGLTQVRATREALGTSWVDSKGITGTDGARTRPDAAHVMLTNTMRGSWARPSMLVHALARTATQGRRPVALAGVHSGRGLPGLAGAPRGAADEVRTSRRPRRPGLRGRVSTRRNTR
jgi:hypothetical protein